MPSGTKRQKTRRRNHGESQRQIRKDRRRANAAGKRNAFKL
jgi:hypothetical protein